MSEPTYRIELTHDPASGANVRWQAVVYLVADDAYRAFDTWAATREDAFTIAQDWCKAKAQEPEPSSTVYLNEDGEIHKELFVA